MGTISSFAELPRHIAFPRLRRDGVYSIVLLVGHSREKKDRRAAHLRTAILFGWAFPFAGGPTANKWHTNAVRFDKIPGEYEFGMRTLSCYLSPAAVMSLARALSDGCSLAEASSELRIDNLPTELSNVRLSGGTTGGRVFQPPIILKPLDVTRRLVGYLKPETSPASHTVAYSASTRLVEKRALTETLAPDASSETEGSLWVWIAKSLTAKTGLDFAHSDAGRVGDFEVLDFPCGDVYGGTAIEWACEVVRESVPSSIDGRSCRAVEIRIKKAPGTVFGEDLDSVYLRCQLGTDNDVVSDEIRPTTFDGDTIISRFESPTEICKVAFWVWVGRGDSTALVYQDHRPLVRVIKRNVGLVGATGRLAGGWSKHVKPASADKTEAESFRRVLYESGSLGGYNKDPWVPAARAQREMMARLVPDTSGATFFAKGWEVELADWLKKLSDGVHLGSLLLVDPFFDEAPLVHLFARAGVESADYSVLTEFNHRPNMGSASRGGVVAQCKAMRAILPRQFRILEVGPKESKADSQILHDRFIVLRDQAGEVVSAFSLTNSLQGATRQHPMLVMPIPRDVLPQVLEYIEQVRTGQLSSGGSTSVTTIWQSESAAKSGTPKIHSPNFELIAEFFLGTDLGASGDEGARAALEKEGMYDPSRDRFNPIAVRRQLDEIEKKGSQRDLATARAWSAVSEVSVRMDEDAGLDLLDALVLAAGEGGNDLPERVIMEAPSHIYFIGAADAECTAHDLSIAHATQRSFATAVTFADSLLSNPRQFRKRTPWPFFQAVRYLIQRFPQRAVRALEYLVSGYERTLDVQLRDASEPVLGAGDFTGSWERCCISPFRAPR